MSISRTPGSTPGTTPVRASDRLQDVFERDERLIDILASHAPQLAKLRNSPMRRIMARVTTVEQAARLCGMLAASLVHELNDALGIDSSSNDGGDSIVSSNAALGDCKQVVSSLACEPDTMTSHTRTVELDVRDDLRNGREPFSTIMAAVAALGNTEALHLRTTFEPVPLFAVMHKRGFAHHAEQHGPEDWSVWFYRPEASSTGQVVPTAAQTEPSVESTPGQEKRPEEVWLDVRGLEPPEPMVRTLGALEDLPTESVLIQVNVRVPQLLLPLLRERGFAFEIDESHADQVCVRIWRASPASTR